ncbi:hypothetical protein APED_25345 [Acanthopleuribacter pedis]
MILTFHQVIFIDKNKNETDYIMIYKLCDVIRIAGEPFSAKVLFAGYLIAPF